MKSGTIPSATRPFPALAGMARKLRQASAAIAPAGDKLPSMRGTGVEVLPERIDERQAAVHGRDRVFPHGPLVSDQTTRGAGRETG